MLAYTVMEKNLSLFFGANHANCLPFVMQFMDNPAQLLMNHPAQLTMNSRSFPSTTARWEWNYIIIHWRGVVEFGWELWSAELERSHIRVNNFCSQISICFTPLRKCCKVKNFRISHQSGIFMLFNMKWYDNNIMALKQQLLYIILCFFMDLIWPQLLRFFAKIL